MEQLQNVDTLKKAVVHTREAMEGFAKFMAGMTKQNEQDTPEYHEALAEYQAMARLVNDATKLLKAYEEQETHDRQDSQVKAVSHDLTGISPIKGTLGMRGQPGATSMGTEVTNLQKFLTAVGFAVPESGEFDVKTRLAVQQFQGRFSLKADGVVGAAMRKLVNEMLQRQ